MGTLQAPEALDHLFHALADASRRRMVDRLSNGPASVKELAQPLTMALPSAMKHLAVLEAGGIATSEKVGRVRTYRLVPAGLAAIEKWVAQREARWSGHFDRLEEYLAEHADERAAGGDE